MNKYSSNINDYRAITKPLVINSNFNTIAEYCRIDNIRGFDNSVVTTTVSVSSKCYDKACSTSVSINECNVIAGYYQITEDNASIDIGTNNRFRTTGYGDNCLIQAYINIAGYCRIIYK